MDSIIYLAFLLCFLSGCVIVKYHDYAVINKDIAIETIHKLKIDTILIVVPTFQKKETLLKNISKRRGKKWKQNKQRLLNLYAVRQIQQEALIQSFIKNYTFSELLFIPDSLVSVLESGIEGHYFLNENVCIDTTIQYTNTNPIKLIQQFEQEWQIKIRTEMIPNPFPNYYVYRNGLYGFLGEETYDDMYERVASVFQKRFERFNADPDRRIYL